MRLPIILDVDDKWEPGYCDKCPLSYTEDMYDEDDGWDFWTVCVLHGTYENCPLVEMKGE